MALACFRAASLLAVTAGLGMTAGCVIEDDGLDTTEQAIISEPCPPQVCGKNSPELSEPFFELYEGEGGNDQGLVIDGIYFGGVQWKLDVVGNQLKARKGFLVKSGVNVIGGVILIKDLRGTVYRITVDNALVTQLYPSGTGTTWAYELNWRVNGTRDAPVNLCKDPESMMGEQDTLFQNKFTAILYEGERYDEHKLTIRENVSTTGWFNIGCAGEMLSKMHLTHHSVSSSGGGYTTTEKERIAIMKMFAADYCGTGHGFTVSGTPLSWTDDHAWLPHVWDLDNYAVKIEARWSDRGATCVETPRLWKTEDPDALAEFGDDVGAEIWSLIAAECPVPPLCSDVEDDSVIDTWSKHLVSGNPHFD